MRWFALVLLFGCGDNLAGIDPAARSEAEVAARCEQLTRCGLFTDQATCVAFVRPTNDAAVLAAIVNGVIQYNAIAEQTCVQELAKISCDRTAPDFRSVPLSCQGALLGDLSVGAACAFDEECVTGRCALTTCPRTECCMGTCKPVVQPVGGDCQLDDDCAKPGYCGSDSKCHALVKAGGACPNDSACDYGLGCVGASSVAPGTCRKLPKIGEACPYDRCAELGARCSAGTCVALGLAGAPCATDTECSPYARCDVASGRCAEVPTRGMPCDGRCAGEAFCKAGTCVPPLDNGEPCNADNECASQLCAEGPIFDVCVARRVCF